MILWITIFFVLVAVTSVSIIYVSCGIYSVITEIRKSSVSLPPDKTDLRRLKGLSLLSSLVLFSALALLLHIINAVIIFMHLAFIWALCSLTMRLMRRKGAGYIKRLSAVTAAAVTLIILSAGWYLDHNVWRTEYSLVTHKQIKPLKIVMFADSHIGTTFDAAGFAGHLDRMQRENPDMIIVAGDFVDDCTLKDEMIASVRALGKIKTKFGIFFAHGNHDKGYYGDQSRGYSVTEMTDEMRRNGITVLEDEISQLPGNVVIIGRRDLSVEKELKSRRRTPQELRYSISGDPYTVVIDHQPSDYRNLADAGFDLVLSGHTHGGQIFPFNNVGKFAGVLDLVYGYARQDGTDFIVTSGISDWAIKFKTGTFSEYTVINITPE
jgi:predicted MPP superfamily phosphohydrolase